MPTYRVYWIEAGRIRRVPEMFDCESDQAAIDKTKQWVDRHDIELWEGTRFVMSFKAGHQK